MENESELLTLDEIRAKLIEISDEEVYTLRRIKQKLQNRYKGNIFFAEISGWKNVKCFKNMANWIISDQWYNKRSNADDEAKPIIEIVAKLIKSNIRDNLKRSTDTYPFTDDAFSVGWIPNTLRHFLKHVIKSEVKVERIGHCIMKSALPTSLTPPILLAMAVELDHMHGSKWLNTKLFKLGFSESYIEASSKRLL